MNIQHCVKMAKHHWQWAKEAHNMPGLFQYHKTKSREWINTARACK